MTLLRYRQLTLNKLSVFLRCSCSGVGKASSCCCHGMNEQLFLLPANLKAVEGLTAEKSYHGEVLAVFVTIRSYLIDL